MVAMSKQKINFDSPDFERKRYHIDVSGAKSKVHLKAQLDSGADVSIISESLISLIFPSWKNYPSAGKMTVQAVNGEDMDIIGTRWLNIILSGHVKPLQQKFVILKDGEEFLLGADFMYDHQINIIQDGAHSKNYIELPSKYSKRNKKEKVNLFVDNTEYIAKSSDYLQLEPLSKSIIDFTITTKMEGAGSREILIATDHMSSTVPGVLTIPSLCQVKNTYGIQVAIINLTQDTVYLNPGDLEVWVEEIMPDDKFIVTADDVKPEEFYSTVKKLNATVVKQAVVSSPYFNMSSKCKRPTDDKYDYVEPPDYEKIEDVNHDQNILQPQEEFDPFNPEMEGYYDPEDTVEFGLENALAENALFKPRQCAIDPMDLIPYHKIEREFWPIAKYLFSKYRSCIALHSYDIGDISWSLGLLYIPLMKALPKPQKVYFGSADNMLMMKSILDSMVHYKILKPSTATYGASVFQLLLLIYELS